jgi:hypothetical protein
VPEILEVELYRALAEKGLHREIADVWMVDARYGRGGTTTSGLKAPWSATSSPRLGGAGSCSFSIPTAVPRSVSALA